MKIDKKLVLIGSDFEMFLKDKKGKVISAIPFNSGTKEKPEKLHRDGCCIQRDGVLQECNVPPVGLNSWKQFWDNIEFVTGYVGGMIQKKGLIVDCCPSATFDDDELTEKEARIFGCSQDYLAWQEGSVNEIERDENTNLRCCGGHIHISYPGAKATTSVELMKVFDLFLTVPSLLIDFDTERRKLYGKAGSFRLCDWGTAKGFEARTLSNYWIQRDEYTEYIFSQLNDMFDHYNKYGCAAVDEKAYEIVSAINDHDIDKAEALCDQFDIFLPTLVEQKALWV